MSASVHLNNLPMPGPYARDWKRLVEIAKANPEAVLNIKVFGLYGTPAWVARRNFVRALDERINVRGGIYSPGVYASANEGRLWRRRDRMVKAGRLVMECRWCGSKLNSRGLYLRNHDRFCDADCKRSYNS